MDLFQRQLHADDPRRRREHAVRTNLALLGHPNAYAVGGFQPLFSGGAVGIAGVDDQRPDLPLPTAQMLAPNRYGRSDDLISREHRGGGSAVGSQGQS